MMKVHTALAGIGAVALAGGATAGFIGAHVENLGDLGGGTTTWRVYVDFDSPSDKVLAVSGNADVAALVFDGLGNSLVNEAGAFNGLDFEDVPSILASDWDSWVTIGNASPTGNDTSFSPGFLGGGDGSSIIHGSSFSQADNGGWFDSNPGTVDGAGPSVLIAQFTIANFSLSGTVDWQTTGAGVVSSAFSVSPVPAPGALALLGLAGLVGRRRR